MGCFPVYCPVDINYSPFPFAVSSKSLSDSGTLAEDRRPSSCCYPCPNPWHLKMPGRQVAGYLLGTSRTPDTAWSTLRGLSHLTLMTSPAGRSSDYPFYRGQNWDLETVESRWHMHWVLEDIKELARGLKRGRPPKQTEWHGERQGNEEKHCVFGKGYNPRWLDHKVLRQNCL